MRWLLSMFLILGVALPALSETVDVKYRGPVDLKVFACQSVARSSLINRICYDPKNSYMIIMLNDTYYHYCDIPSDVVANLKRADSMGRYFSANIRGRYDCRNGHVPTY
jgi:hypothetical protein